MRVYNFKAIIITIKITKAKPEGMSFRSYRASLIGVTRKVPRLTRKVPRLTGHGSFRYLSN